MIRAVLADDHRVFTQCLAAVLEANGIEIAATTHDRDVLLAVIRQHRPNIAVVDVSMSGIAIDTLLAQTCQQQSTTRWLVLTAACEPQVAKDLLRAGALGFMLKEHSLADILAAIHCVASGKTYVSPRVATLLLDWPTAESADQRLTVRQLEVLRLVAAGDTSKRIARRLGIHVKTVDNHRHRIRQKLGARSAAEMVRVAGDRGLL